ncbi:pyruvate formate lyase-activating protein [Caldimicrobium thiodismutans]|uniref:Pyruvate formate lyase-activating protein n=1 Tax=Caldimicrobium thiodismutans TaxID=1653476 RepID=A0A0U4W329_9BACT|nr:pyruvate formate lyase-activating protein [Caldimicrobium thiodismutans]
MSLKTCLICGERKILSSFIGICKDCLRDNFNRAKPFLEKAHKESRKAFSLPEETPTDKEGISCPICARGCRIAEGEYGYCGLRKILKGKLLGPKIREARVSWYLDPLPTNCVADWICPGGTGCGYPKFAYRSGPEYGYYNLAVFFEACNLNCLYCQNWHFKYATFATRYKTLEEFLEAITPQVACICFFGGDPSPQAPFAIKASFEALKNKKGKILRICWETNGHFSPHLLPKVIETSLVSGGIIKFDLKALTPEIYFALTGGSLNPVLENFKKVAEYFKERPEVSLLTASTLLVPGYVEEEEVEKIAQFIAEINPQIPYRILAFSPQFYMKDLPLISKEVAYRALERAKKAGLKRVSLGNEHLLK